jgi:spore coat protein A
LSPNRRTFLQNATAAALAASSRLTLAQQMSGMAMQQTPPQAGTKTVTIPDAVPQKLPPMLRASDLTPFVDQLPLPAVAHPDSSGHIAMAMREVHTKLHRDLPPTRQWVYSRAAHHDTLSPLLELKSHQPTSVTWSNQLPTKHFLPIDYSLHGCGHDLPEVRACVHLHGGRNRSRDDGYPDSWYTPGHAFAAHYPLEQDAATLWYHDHAMGLNRLNIYAGLFGMALLRDEQEAALNLPSGTYELPITLCDRLLTAQGQLFYPDSGIPGHPWVSDFVGDAILLNGKLHPFIHLEPRLYRLRLLNCANSRFFNLSFSGQAHFHQIGSDQGLLAAPLPLTTLTLAPAERSDILLDLSSFAGQNLHLLNDMQPVMQLRVAAAPTTTHSIPTALRRIDRISESDATVTRTITLNEALDHIGNSMEMVLNYKHWHEPVTETPKLNSTEIWEFVNLTEDTHPMHLHLVRFQILDRRVFEPFSYRNGKGFRYLSDKLPPAANELGWKDIVPCPPGMVTRIIVSFDGYPGKYLYHCHVLEHEANDMMRPFEVIA